MDLRDYRWQSSIDKGTATSSLMCTPRGRLHGSGHYPVIQRCLLHDAASMPSVPPFYKGRKEGRWYEPVRSLFRCIPVNGLAPMQAGAMATIVVNWLQHSRPSRPT